MKRNTRPEPGAIVRADRATACVYGGYSLPRVLSFLTSPEQLPGFGAGTVAGGFPPARWIIRDHRLLASCVATMSAAALPEDAPVRTTRVVLAAEPISTTAGELLMAPLAARQAPSRSREGKRTIGRRQ